MRVQVNNQAGIPNKYIRLVKWKSYKVKAKFDRLIYTEIFISKEGKNPTVYHSVVKLGVPGHDIILKNKSEVLNDLWKESFEAVERYLRKEKERRTKREVQTSL